MFVISILNLFCRVRTKSVSNFMISLFLKKSYFIKGFIKKYRFGVVGNMNIYSIYKTWLGISFPLLMRITKTIEAGRWRRVGREHEEVARTNDGELSAYLRTLSRR